MKKPYAVVKFFLNGDESGQLQTIEFDYYKHYTDWMEDMKKSIEIFSEEF